MKYWVGSILAAYAVYLLIAARQYRQTVLAARADAVRLGRPTERDIAPQSILAFAEIVTPIVLFLLVVLTSMVCLAYVYLDGHQLLSHFDLAAFLAMVAAYAYWFTATTKMLMPPHIIETESAARQDTKSRDQRAHAARVAEDAAA